MARSVVTDRDRGARELMKRVFGKHSLRVGVFGDLAAQKAIDGKGATVGDVASGHEFVIPGGTGRRWLRGTFEQEADRIRVAIRRAAEAIVMRKMDRRSALDLLGHGMVGLVKRRITAGIPPALSAAYLPRKLRKYPGATTPLIASSQFLGSISHEVEQTGKAA